MWLALNKHVSVQILSGRCSLPYVRRHAVEDRPWDSESRRHHLRVAFVKAIDVLAHCRHRIVRAHLWYSVLRWRLRILSGHLGNRCIRQYRTETNAERNTVEITTFHAIVTLKFTAVVLISYWPLSGVTASGQACLRKQP